MHYLGHTRSAHCADHLLQTPDTFVRAPLPGMRNATAVVHIAPSGGARFTQYTAEFEADGLLPPPESQRFAYVLDGEVRVGSRVLGKEDYVYCPPASGIALTSAASARVAIIEKPYVPLAGIDAPEFFIGRESQVRAEHLNGDPALEVRSLIPPGRRFDFAVNTMVYQPGATLPMVEIHVMEHGLLMLEGGGIYRLGDRWYPVEAGDFIWMAPHCPQWFGALGKKPAKYLIYKDWNR